MENNLVRPIMNVNLKLLQVFLLVAEHCSFRSAAVAANRSQSAISTQIKQLEGQLGVALFHRTTRSVGLTAEGQELVDCVRRALYEVDAGLRKIAEYAELRRGHVSIGCSPTIAGTRLPAVLVAFGREYPAVKLFVEEVTSEGLHDRLRKREVDFGVGPVLDKPDFVYDRILKEELYALVPRRLFQTIGSTISFRELLEMPVLLLNPASALRAIIEDAVVQHGLKLSTNYQFAQTQSLISASAAGLGAAILPKIAIPETVHPDLQALRIIDPVITREIAIIMPRGHNLSPAAARLAELLAAMMSDEHRSPSPRRKARD